MGWQGVRSLDFQEGLFQMGGIPLSRRLVGCCPWRFFRSFGLSVINAGEAINMNTTPVLNKHRTESYVDWPAIFAGPLSLVAIGLLLTSFGSGAWLVVDHAWTGTDKFFATL